MDQQLMSRLLAAIELIHNPMTGLNERRQAQEFVEEFKRNLVTGLGVYAIALVNKDHNDVVRHFGFHLIEYMITQQWGVGLQAPQKEEIKNMLMQYAASGTKPVLQEKQFIKTKLCALIVAVMKREWPTRMPDLLSQILQLVTMGPTQCELGIIILRTIAQEVSTEFSSDLDSDRRKEIVDGLSRKIEDIFSLIYDLFDTCYKQYQTSPPNSEQRATNEKLLAELLDTSLAFVNEWVSPTVFFRCNFIKVWCHLLTEENLKQGASECLLMISGKKWRDCNVPKADILSFIDSFSTVCTTVMKNTNPDTIMDDYEFHKNLAKIVSSFGTVNLHNLKQDSTAMIEKFLDVVLHFSKYPSLMICHEASQVWIQILEKKTGKKESTAMNYASLPFFEKYYSALVEVCSSKMLREVGNPENEQFSNSLIYQTSVVDFQDKRDYLEFFALFRSKLATLVRLVTHKNMTFMLEYAGRGMESVLKKNGPSPNDKLMPNGFIDMTSQTYVLWEAASSLLDWVIAAINWKELKPDNQAYKMLEIILGLLLKFQTKDPLIQTRYLTCLQSLSPLFVYNNKALDVTLQHLYTHMQFRLDKEANMPVSQLSEDSSSTRRKAFSVFINLCNNHSGYLLPSLNAFVDSAEKLWREKRISSAESIMLYEAFVVISNQWKDYDKQFNFLVYLLNNLKDEWKSKPFSEVLGSEELLLKCLGVIEERDEPKRNALREVRDKVLHTLNMFRSIAKRMPSRPEDMGLSFKTTNLSGRQVMSARYPIAPFLLEILPNVLSFIRTLHSISRPQVQQQIPIEKRKPIFEVGIDEAQHMLGQTFTSTSLSEYEQYLYSTHKSLLKMRTHCYELLGFACKYCENSFWGNQQLYTLLSNSVFAFLDDISNRDLRILLEHFVTRFVTSCPKELYSNLLKPVLLSLYTLIYNRLDAGWNQLIQITKGIVDLNGLTTATDEVIQEHFLRALTREVIELPLLMVKSMGQQAVNKNITPDALATFVVSTEPIVAILLMITTRIITLPDSLSVQKAVQFTQKVIPPLATSPKLQMIVGGELFQTTITALMITKPEMHPVLTALAADIYFRFSEMCQFPDVVLAQLPQIGKQQITNLKTAMKKKDMNEKKFTGTMKSFVKNIVGKKTGEYSTRRTILKIGPPRQQQDNTNSSFLDSMTLESVANLFK